MAAITVADLAQELGTDARTTRKFLRSVTPKEDQPGKGSRWSIEKKELRSLRKKFTAFQENQRKVEESPAEEPVAEVEVDEEPTAEDLAALEAELEIDEEV